LTGTKHSSLLRSSISDERKKSFIKMEKEQERKKRKERKKREK
jgi:hypothetical protein